MPIELFGFSLGRKGKTSPQASTSQSGGEKAKSFVPPDFDDGAIQVEGGLPGFYGTYLDVEGAIKNDIGLINKYRDMSLHPEAEMAIDDIVNEAIVYDETKKPVTLNLDLLTISDTIKSKIEGEFEGVLRLLDFGNRGYEIFRRWYIDGKLYYHIMLNDQSKKGISELRPVDATKIRLIRKIEKKRLQKGPSNIDIVDHVEEFYMYTDTDKNPSATEGIKVALDSISYIHSGLYDRSGKRVVGYLQKAIKPLNQLRMIEDAVVIYRISRAPERRIFYIDVGNLPKNKAEQYLKDIMNRYRNKLVYDASTGEIRDDKRHMSMLEDYWLPRREGGRGTEI
ncbi:TPA: portal protein, partial [Candidatus Woesearchaeota archaeon]|nr:portal protein [Candidatus Woesearchaeota archaeon]